MRDFTTTSGASLPDVKADDFLPRLKNALSAIEYWALDASRGFARIESGQVPSGSGGTLGGVTSHHSLTDLTTFDDHSQYLYLAGRSGGQTVSATAATDNILQFVTVGTFTGDVIRATDASSNLFLRVERNGAVVVTDPLVFSVGSHPLVDVSMQGASNASSLIVARVGATEVCSMNSSGAFTSFSNNAATSGAGSGSGASFGQYISAGTTLGAMLDLSVHGPLMFDMTALPNHTGNVVYTCQNASGTLLLHNQDTTVTGTFTFAKATDSIKLIAKANATQTADLQQWQNSAGTALTVITAAGAVLCPSVGIAGLWTIDTNGINDSIGIIDTGTGNTGTITFGGISAGQTYNWPATGGTLITSTNTVTLSAKTLGTTCNINCNTGTGVTFRDAAATTKQMRFDLTGITTSATRNVKYPDVSGTLTLVGNTASASGTLGISDLTAQTTSIGATTLLTGNASSAGMYRVTVYAKTTTAGNAGDVVKATVSWNDGAAQTMDVPFLTTGGAATNLDLGTLNAFAQGSVVVNSAASQNISYTTTVTKAGTPQYEIHVRIETL